MKILHGEDLMISIDGVALLAAKSCDIKIKAATQKKSSPTSGEWEEVVAVKKAWSVATSHLVYAGTQPTLSNTNTFYLNAFNNATEGWRVLGECEATVDNQTQLNIIDQKGSIDEGIYVLTIAKQTGTITDLEYIPTEGWSYLSNYLPSDSDKIFVLATIGKYAINRAMCTTLNNTYHVPMPFVELGGTINNETVYVDTPLLLMGGKGIEQGMCAYGQTDNVIKATFYNGVLPVANGLSGMAIKVGQMCTLRMRNANDQTVMTGQALCTEFDVSAAKNALMKGNFAWKGNGELNTSAYQPTTKDLVPYVNYITIDMNKKNPAEMITGDINGNIIQNIRKSFHRYLAKYDSSEGVLLMCQLNDNASYLYNDGTEATLDGTRGDVLVKHKTFYTYTAPISSGIYRIGFAEVNLGTAWKEWNENDMIGAYEGSCTSERYGTTPYTSDYDSGYLRSISGITPIKNVQANYYETKANISGTGFTTVKMRHHNIMGVLLMAIAGTTNSQAVYGNGVPSESGIVATGGTNEFGMNDTNAGVIGSVNFCGIENWWSNVMEYISDVFIYNNRSWVANNQSITGVDIEGNRGFVAKMAIGQNLNLVPTEIQDRVTDTYKGNPQQGFCDWFDAASGATSSTGVGRSGNTNEEKAGAFYLYAGLSFNSKMEKLGTRLCYQGPFAILSPQQYKALWNN